MKTKIIDCSVFLKGYSSIYVGFSGGADSTALLLLLKDISLEYNFDITAIHFEHGLRGNESLDDEKWCKNFCEKEGIKYLSYQLAVLENKRISEGIEEAARRLRLKKWKSIIDSHKQQNSSARIAIALAHHEDDKIENMFLRLIRGSNSSGLTSLREYSNIENLEIIRPLLNLSKADLIEYLATKGVNNWREDSSNKDSEYRRNFIRNELFPLIQKRIKIFSKSINTSYIVLEEDAKYIEEVSTKLYIEAYNKRNGHLILDKLPNNKAILSRVIRYWIRDFTGNDVVLSRSTILRIEKNFQNRKESRGILIPINKNLFFKMKNGTGSLESTYKIHDKDAPEKIIWDWINKKEIEFNGYKINVESVKILNIDIKKSDNIVVFPRNKICDNLIIKTWKIGDKILPFGGKQKIKISKIFQNKKIDIRERENVPLIHDPDGNILWVCGIIRSSLYPIEKIDKDIVVFKCSRLEN